jgi:hypothetical protein
MPLRMLFSEGRLAIRGDITIAMRFSARTGL